MTVQTTNFEPFLNVINEALKDAELIIKFVKGTLTRKIAEWYDHIITFHSIFLVLATALFLVLYPYALYSLRKHAYSNILKVLPPKIIKFSDKNF